MKKTWKQPNLEVLRVQNTMKFFPPKPPGKGDSGNQDESENNGNFDS